MHYAALKDNFQYFSTKKMHYAALKDNFQYFSTKKMHYASIRLLSTYRKVMTRAGTIECCFITFVPVIIITVLKDTYNN